MGVGYFCFPPFRATCVLSDTNHCTSDFSFSSGIKGLDSTQQYVPSFARIMAAAQRRGQDSHPLRPLRVRATAAWASLPTGRTQEVLPGQSSGRPRIRFRPLPFACGSPLHVSVFGYVRPLAEGLGKPRCAELGRGGGSQAGEWPPPCKSPRALNSPELGQPRALLPASVVSLNSWGYTCHQL